MSLPAQTEAGASLNKVSSASYSDKLLTFERENLTRLQDICTRLAAFEYKLSGPRPTGPSDPTPDPEPVDYFLGRLREMQESSNFILSDIEQILTTLEDFL